MKKGLVLEGGAMRGLFTAGVIDVFIENNIEFDGIVGVSAGAAFGCNYKSRQIGRTLRYNKKYCKNKNYVSLRSLVQTGDLYNVDFAYRQIPEILDPFDNEAFNNSPVEFYTVATDAETGKAVYHKCDTAVGENLQWIRASASLPLVSRLVEINGSLYSDGGMSDSIPIKFFQNKGYHKNVVVLTRPIDYSKSQNPLMPIIKIILKKHPFLAKALAERHIHYNQTLKYLKEEEKKGTTIVIRPRKSLKIKKIERKPEMFDAVYNHGREVALSMLDDIRNFLEKE